MTAARDRSSVGVVIPTYERVEATVLAVRSALEQTLPPRSIVVVDDGSSRDTTDALAARLDGLPVTLVRTAPTGHPGKARNTGVQHLTTEWVALLDSDDVWHPGKLEAQLDAATVTGDDAVSTNARRVVGGRAVGLVVADLPERVTLRRLLQANVVINSSVLVRRAALDRVGGVASSYLVRGCEDYATWLRIATHYRWCGLSEAHVDYRDEPSASIRGDEEFAVHPGQQAAWLDYVLWRRSTGSPARLAEAVLARAVRHALTLDAGARGLRRSWRAG